MKNFNNFGASGSRMTKRRLLEEARNSTWQISVQNVISSFLILILLFVSYSLISFNFYLFYFPGAAAEPLGSARGALRGSTEHRLGTSVLGYWVLGAGKPDLVVSIVGTMT